MPQRNAYTFAVDLSEAIESALDGIPQGKLLYRGVDFRGALGCYLYFATINDEALLEAYLASSGDSAPLPGPISSLLAGQPNPLPPFRASLRHAVRRYLPKRLLQRSIVPRIQFPPPLLIFVQKIKFVRYVEKLFPTFPSGSVFLTEHPEVEVFLQEKGFPYMRLGLSKFLRGQLLVSSAYHLGLLYDAMEEVLHSSQTRRVVVVEGNAPEDRIMGEACRKLRIPCDCLQQGWSPIVHSAFRSMTYSRMLVWGKAFIPLLAPYNPKLHFQVVGNHVIELPLLEEEKGTAIAFFFQGITPLITRKTWEEMVALTEWCAETFPDREILVREHPGEPFSEELLSRLRLHPNLRLLPPSVAPLGDLFRQAEISVAIYSSTILESMAAGVWPLIFNPTPIPRYNPDLAAANVATEVKSLEEAKSTLHVLLADGQSRTRKIALAVACPSYIRHTGASAVAEVRCALTENNP